MGCLLLRPRDFTHDSVCNGVMGRWGGGGGAEERRRGGEKEGGQGYTEIAYVAHVVFSEMS
jgi:hypothetical protein